MAQQFRNPGGIFDIGFAAWHSLDVLRIHDKPFALAFQEIVDWTPIHASQNVAKRILEWEYGIEIERTRLRMYPAEQRPASSSDTVSSHEGTCPHGAGVSHGQAVLSASLASGGDRHV